jgi:hypothetical protein
MQHSTVRSIIIWLWKDQLASGLIEVTIPNTNNQVNNTLRRREAPLLYKGDRVAVFKGIIIFLLLLYI